MDLAALNILVVNAGSSSLKLSLISEAANGGASDGDASSDGDIGNGDSETLADKLIEGWQVGDLKPLSDFVASVGQPDAVAHRVVHGGTRFPGAVIVDDEARAGIAELGSLAPLHQRYSVGAIDAARSLLGGVPHVACFDTAFHTTIRAAATTYALPRRWRAAWPVRRYGFHGLSHSYSARRAPEIAAASAGGLRLVSCHLGSGASLCAIADGRSVDTTMGFTPLEGLVMGTRSGSVDPGLVLWLLQQAGLGADEVSSGLQREGGLAGLAGTNDMRKVVAGAAAGDDNCGLALDVYIHRLVQYTAAMVVSLGGVDILAFTGGVGEHAVEVRRRACTELAFLGIAVDDAANCSAQGDADITAGGDRAAASSPRTVVITAREDLEMARQTRALLDR